MAVKELYGDLLELAKTGIIVQQVNCQNAMGAGFAKAIYKKYPIVKTKYHEHCGNALTVESLLGTYQIIKVADDLWVINSFTQLYYGRRPGVTYTDETKLIANLLKIDHLNKASHNKPLYIPKKIGCNLGGGNWDTIRNAIFDTNYIIVDCSRNLKMR